MRSLEILGEPETKELFKLLVKRQKEQGNDNSEAGMRCWSKTTTLQILPCEIITSLCHFAKIAASDWINLYFLFQYRYIDIKFLCILCVEYSVPVLKQFVFNVKILGIICCLCFAVKRSHPKHSAECINNFCDFCSSKCHGRTVRILLWLILMS